MTQSEFRARVAENPGDSAARKVRGNSDVGHVLRIIDRGMIETSHLVIARNYLKRRRRDNLNRYDVLFNAISDPDANPETLRIARRLMKQTSRPCINDPRDVARTTRDRVAGALAAIDGLRVPKTARIKSLDRDRIAQAINNMGIDFPVLVRRTGTQTGQTLQKLDSLNDAADQSADKGDWYVTEFVDFQSPGGLYLKYRAFVIGDKVTISHVFPSESWNVHWSSAAELFTKHPDYSALGTWDVVGNRVNQIPVFEETLLAVKDVLKLDYFGVDFAILGNSLLLFEANAAMNHFPVERYATRVAMGDMISSLVDLVCQKIYGAEPPERLHCVPPVSLAQQRPRPSQEAVVIPELPVEVTVLTGSDSKGDSVEAGDKTAYPDAAEWRTIFRQLEGYIDRNLIKFRVFDFEEDFSKISDRFSNGRAAIAFNLTADPSGNPRTFKELAALKERTDTIWINDPAATGALADDFEHGTSPDQSAFVLADGAGNLADKRLVDQIRRNYRLLFIGGQASIVGFSLRRSADSNAGSSPNLMGGDEALQQQERDALIGNRLSGDPALLAGLHELRASIKADVFGLECAPLADGRLAILRIDPSWLDLPYRKYRGLTAWRPAAALSRLVHQRAIGIA